MTFFPRIFIIAGILFAAGAGAADNDVNPLLAERWKTRPLLIVAPSATDATLVKMQDIFQLPTNRNAFEEREMVLFVVVGDMATRNDVRLTSGQARALRRAVEVPAGAPATVLLVGKDGGIKMREQGVIDARTLFGTIDQMPMRRGGS